MSGAQNYLSLVKFQHSIFALPFALQGAWIAAGGLPALDRLGWIVLCAVCARTAAMAFNRLVDRHMDAQNPRTRERELPRGVLTPISVAVLVLASSAGFVLGAHQLGPWCGKPSYGVPVLVLGYSYVKRLSLRAHGARARGGGPGGPRRVHRRGRKPGEARVGSRAAGHRAARTGEPARTHDGRSDAALRAVLRPVRQRSGVLPAPRRAASHRGDQQCWRPGIGL